MIPLDCPYEDFSKGAFKSKGVTNLAPRDLSKIVAAHVDPRARSFVLSAIEDAACSAINTAIAHERQRVLGAIYTDSMRYSEEVQDFAYTAIKRYS